MKNSDKEEVFQINCPNCNAVLWVDSVIHKVIKSEKGRRKKDSLEALLLKEKRRSEEFERKFEATAELSKKKREETKEKFKKALTDFDKNEEKIED